MNRRPVNATAARVVSAGTHYRPNKRHGSQVFEVCPPIRQATRRDRSVPGYSDLAGVRRGRLVAIGLSEGAALKWVMRCDCGAYVIRTNKAARNEANTADACEECLHVMYLKRSEFYRRTGKDTELKTFI
jgi:hypothetical protein